MLFLQYTLPPSRFQCLVSGLHILSTCKPSVVLRLHSRFLFTAIFNGGQQMGCLDSHIIYDRCVIYLIYPVYLLFSANMFPRLSISLSVLPTNSLDPITSIKHAGSPTKQVLWMEFSLELDKWECVNATCMLISDANQIQHLFSHKHQATLWQAIPVFEKLQSAWEAKHDHQQFKPYKKDLNCGLNKIGKYYNKFNEKCTQYVFHLYGLYYLMLLQFYTHTINLPTSR